MNKICFRVVNIPNISFCGPHGQLLSALLTSSDLIPRRKRFLCCFVFSFSIDFGRTSLLPATGVYSIVCFCVTLPAQRIAQNGRPPFVIYNNYESYRKKKGKKKKRWAEEYVYNVREFFFPQETLRCPDIQELTYLN